MLKARYNTYFFLEKKSQIRNKPFLFIEMTACKFVLIFMS